MTKPFLVAIDPGFEREEREANEFAGQLLMPEFFINNCNFYSLERTAEYLMPKIP